MKKLAWIAVVCALVGAEGSAQAFPACDSALALDQLPEGQLPDVLHQPLAYPGAFGGEVTCVTEKTAKGYEKYIAEFLPESTGIKAYIDYRQNSIAYFVKLHEEEEGHARMASCAVTGDAGLLCQVDVSAGHGVWILRRFDADFALVRLQALVEPGAGVLAPEVWQALAPQLHDGSGELKMSWSLPLNDQTWTMTPLSANGAVFSVDEAKVAALVEALAQGEHSVRIHASYQTVGAEDVATLRDIDKSTVNFAIGALGAIEQLIAAGYEASRALKF